MKRLIVAMVLCLSALAAHSVSAQQALKFADVLTDNMVLQRGREVNCWGTAPAGSKVELLLTQSREEAAAFVGEDALKRPDESAPKLNSGIAKVRLAYIEDEPATFRAVKKTVTADKDGKWETTLGVHEASFIPTYLAARAADARVAIQNLLIGEVWIASGQSNMEWAWTRDKMWENKGLLFNGVRYAKVRGASTSPRESFVGDSDVGKGAAFEPWIVCEDGAVDSVSTVAYLFAQNLHRRLKVPVGIINIAQGGSFAREWCSRELLEQMGSPTVNAQLADFDAKPVDGGAVNWRGGPTELYNARLYPIRKLTTAGVIYMQGENESLCGDNPQYVKTFPGVIQSYRDAIGNPDLPFGIITLQGYGGYQVTREIHYKTHEKTSNTGYIVAHDIGGNIHPSWKRPLAERAVYWALRDVYGVVTGGKRLLIKDVSCADGKARVVFEQRELKNGEWVEGGPVMPWTNDQEPPAGFEIAGKDRAWYRARITIGGSAADGLTLSHALVSDPVAVRYAWGGYPCGNLGSWEDPMPPFRSDDWPVMGPDAVAVAGEGMSESEESYLRSHERKNRELEGGLRLAVAESYENLAKRYAHPKGMLQETVKNMKDLMQVFDAERARELAPDLRQQALHKIPCRYWRRDRYTPERRAKWGWLIDRVLRLETLPEEMEDAVNGAGIKKQLAKVKESLAGLQKEIEKLDDPEDTDFDAKLEKILPVMEKEKARLEGQGVKVGGGELNSNPF